MNAASVGFQCPKCVAEGRSSVRAPRTVVGASVQSGANGTATKVLMGVLLALWVLNFVSDGLVLNLLATPPSLLKPRVAVRVLRPGSRRPPAAVAA